MNQALGALLRGNNTTISIAHRLSTIKRSDRIICINTDGRVAEEGTYQELSSRKDGAFTKLMEWQLSGGGAGEGGGDMMKPARETEPWLTEHEEIQLRHHSDGEEHHDEDRNEEEEDRKEEKKREEIGEEQDVTIVEKVRK